MNQAKSDSAESIDLFESSIPHAAMGQRLDVALARLFPEHSRSRLADLLKAGDLTVDGASPKPSNKVKGGELVVVAMPRLPVDGLYQAEAMALDIVYEDEALMVVNKPAGLVVHPGAGNWTGTLLNGLLAHYPPLATVARAGIVHRLDKDTTGLMVVAKTLVAQTDLVRQLQARTVKREYLAVTHGHPKAERIDAPIGRDPIHRTKMAVQLEEGQGKPAATQVFVLEKHTATSVVRCLLETGRTHQIRVHLAFRGFPLVGDSTYCPPRKLTAVPFPRQALHARALSFVHPMTRQEMSFEAVIPDDMAELLLGLTHD